MRNNVGAVRATVALAVTVALVGGLLLAGNVVARHRRGLVAEIKGTDGSIVGSVRFVPTHNGAVRIRLFARGLTAGFHGFHVHTAGVCDPQATDAAGAASPFFSAGGHFNPASENSHGEHAGDLPPLLAGSDGRTLMRVETDRFKLRDLMDEDGSAVIIHGGPDNLAHVPAASPDGTERYHSHVEDVLGPDAATRATGDAGARFACGVLRRVG